MSNIERVGGTAGSVGEKKAPGLLGFLEVAAELATINVSRDAVVSPQVADRFVALQARRQSLIDQAIENPGDSLLGLRTRNARDLIVLGGDRTKVSEQLDLLGTSLDRVTDPNTRAALEHWIADTQEKIKGSSVAEAPVVSGAKPAQASSVETPKAATPVQEDPRTVEIQKLQEQERLLKAEYGKDPGNDEIKASLGVVESQILKATRLQRETESRQRSAPAQDDQARKAVGQKPVNRTEPTISQEQVRKSEEELQKSVKEEVDLRLQFENKGKEAERVEREIEDTRSGPGDQNREVVDRETEEKRKRIDDLASEQRAIEEKLVDLLSNRSSLFQAITRSSRGRPDVMMGSSGESLPDIREIGPVDLERRFDLILHGLVEKQKDQSFDQNWRLVLPLEMAIQALSFRATEGGVVSGIETCKGHFNEGKPFELNSKQLAELSDQLNRKLNSFRNMHNFIYMFRRVGGTTPIIEADSLLTPDTLETLLRTKEVAAALRDYEKLGEAVYDLKKRAFNVVTGIPTLETRSGLSEKDRAGFKNDKAVIAAGDYESDLNDQASALERKGKALMLGPSSDEEFKQPFWAYRIAGGLFSGLNDSARFDMQINEAGDFFVNRVYNVSSRAKALWEQRSGKFYDPGLYKALDFGLDGFWKETLDYNRKRMENECLERLVNEDIKGKRLVTRERRSELKRQARVTAGSEFNEYLEKLGIDTKKGYLSLVNARFADMVMTKSNINTGRGKIVELKYSDQPKQITLNIDDFNNVRKLLFDSGMILDDPVKYFKEAKEKMWQSIKPLRGFDASRWYAGVTYEMLEIFKNRTDPWSRGQEGRQNKNLAQEFYGRKFVGYSIPDIEAIITHLRPPLTVEDGEKVAEAVTGYTEFGREVELKARGLWHGLLGVVGGMIMGETGIKPER